MVGPGNCRRDYETQHRHPDFPPPCQPAAKKEALKPHLIRYWLTPEPDPQLDREGRRHQHPVSAGPRAGRPRRTDALHSDELTGVQALERGSSGLPLAPGKIERREFEYIRHGTLTFMFNFDVATGQVVTPSYGPTRTGSRLRTTSAGPSPPIRRPKSQLIINNLNTHKSRR